MNNNMTVSTMPFKDFLKSSVIKSKIQEAVGEKALMFATNLNVMVSNNNKLAECDNISILSCALEASALDLPMSKSLGFAYAVPYTYNKGKDDERKEAQFQIGYRGFVQLAIRTGQYKSINVNEIKQGEFRGVNEDTGELVFKFETDYDKRNALNTIGIRASFKLQNDFEQSLYMSNIDLENHAKRFSKSYAYKHKYGNIWKDNQDEMFKKTVIKRLLSKWGIMSVEMQGAVTKDQAVIDLQSNTDYIDNPSSGDEVIAEYTKSQQNKPKEVTI